MRKRWGWVTGSLVLLTVGVALGRNWILKSVLGYGAPSGTGGTREVSNEKEEIRFGFDGAVGANGLPEPWKAQEIVGKLRADVVDIETPGGEKALRLRCDSAHFVVWYEAVPFDPKQYPVVSWAWKAEKIPEKGDVRTRKEFLWSKANRNDKSLQIMIGFEGDHVLNYVWDASAPVGFECPEWSPVAEVRTRVIQSGTAGIGEWHEHRVNVYEDYRRRFGKEPGKVLGVSISANTNHTKAQGDGVVGVIRAGTE